MAVIIGGRMAGCTAWLAEDKHALGPRETGFKLRECRRRVSSAMTGGPEDVGRVWGSSVDGKCEHG